MIGDANCVLSESCIVVAIGIGGGWSEALKIVFRDVVRVGAKRREWKAGFHGCESEGIHFDGIEDIFAALLAREKVIDPGDEGVAAELEGMAAGIEAEGFGKLGAVFASGAGEQVGASDAVDNICNFDESVAGVGVGLAKIAGELSPQGADEGWGEA